MRFRRARMLDLVSGRSSEPHDVLVSGSRLYRSEPPNDPRAGDDEEIDLQGRYMAPGLWDAHVHTDLWAQTSHRIYLASCTNCAQALDTLEAAATQSADPDPDPEPLVALGAPLSRWPGGLDNDHLDALFPDRAVVVCGKDLHSVWANAVALRLVGIAEDGGPRSQARLAREREAFVLERHFVDASDRQLDAWFAQAARQAARRGIVGIVDMQDAPNRLGTWRRRTRSAAPSLRVQLSCWPETLQEALDEHMSTGAPLDEHGWLIGGPLKIISDGSLSSGTAWCSRPCADPAPGIEPHGTSLISRDELSELMSRAEVHGLQVAVHAIGDAAVSQAVDCFAESGARGSIEHLVLASPSDLGRMAELGLRASVQPAQLLDDRSVLERQWPDQSTNAFALRSCVDAGVELRFGSDAPVVPLDPWLAINAAVLRARPGEPSWHPEQALTLSEAMRASTGGVGQLVPGGPADLMVLDEDPFTLETAQLGTDDVYLTMATGQITWWADAV